jgi:hypothetical protein
VLGNNPPPEYSIPEFRGIGRSAAVPAATTRHADGFDSRRDPGATACARRSEAASLHVRQVLLLQNRAVMQFVAGNDIGERPHADFILVGNATPHPGFVVQTPE